MKTNRKTLSSIGLCFVLLFAIGLTGCSEDDPVSPNASPAAPEGKPGSLEEQIEQEFMEAADKGMTIIRQDGSVIPGEIASVEDLSFWPYTSTSLTDSPMDPINLVFKGQVDPVQIRAALMSLDGDRSPYFPDIEPFNLPWTDALGGDVQTTYFTESGWEGCVIQMTLGEYAGLRVHLRLFATDLSDGEGGTWTLGGAHFEMMIPGTSEHQVLSWELAEMVVKFDLARSGLLAAAPETTGPINAAPSFRSIPDYIYNSLVEDPMGQMLLTVLGYPVVPLPPGGSHLLPSDGEGTLLVLGGAVPVDADFVTNSIIIDYDQYIPRPVCSSGPYDWLYVNGPITFTTEVKVTTQGRYKYKTTYDGVLNAVPIDMQTGQPIGDPFDAQVSGKQNGMHNSNGRKVKSVDRRLALQQGEPELFFEILQVGSVGPLSYRAFERCFDGE